MRRAKFFLIAAFALVAAGCAGFISSDESLRMQTMDSELKRLSIEFARYKRSVEPKLAELAPLPGQLKAIRGDFDTLKQELRKGQADLSVSLEEIKSEVKVLTGRFEEAKFESKKGAEGVASLKEEVSPRIYFLENLLKAQENRLTSLEAAANRVQFQLSELDRGMNAFREETQKKIAVLEQSLEKPEAKPKATAPSPPSGSIATPSPPSPRVKPPTPMEAAYQQAFDLFSAGEYKGAREKFKEFSRSYSDSPLLESAKFWMAESSYNLKNYEAAILEYDEFLTKFSQGENAPTAMLKQGLAFLELGDKIDARLLLNQVKTKFPGTEQAKAAEIKLQQIK